MKASILFALARFIVENQKRIINQWITEHALPISHFYIDEKHSASNFDRPAFKQMLENIDTGRIEMFILTTHLYCDILILKCHVIKIGGKQKWLKGVFKAIKNSQERLSIGATN